MEPVPHTGPLRDYAGANHRSCDSSISRCSWQLTRGAVSLLEACSQGGRWGRGGKRGGRSGVYWRFHSWYVISKAKGEIVNSHSNGFIGLTCNPHTHQDTHIFHTRVFCLGLHILHTCNHSKGDLNWKVFVPWGEFVGLGESVLAEA